MNFPNATDAEWSAAREIVYRGASIAGYDPATADDMAQNAMLYAAKKEWRTPLEGPEHAARILVKYCRRCGWNVLSDRRARPVDALRAARRSGGIPADPAWLAERAERLTSGDRRKAESMHAARGVDLMLAAAGIGPYAVVHEAGHTPSVYGSGPGSRIPQEGCPGLHNAPARERIEAYALDGDNLAAYRQQLAAYYNPKVG
jgi:hypothetical protein